MATFPELFSFETQIYELLRVMKEQGNTINQDTINGYAHLIGDYSQTINRSLKKYHDIKDRALKLQGKARLKYAYDFIQILLEILKSIEKTNQFNATLYEIILELFNNQQDLLETQYFIAAKRELDAFNNPQLRSELEQDLAKKHFQKFH